MLKSSQEPLTRAHDVAVLDLDGVVYIGGAAVPEAPESLSNAAAAGMHLAFVTNNAARTPEQVAEHLSSLGVQASSTDVVTSAQAGARLMADRVTSGSEIFVIGGPGLHQALEERDLVPVTTRTDKVAGVVQGYGPDMPWRQVIAGAILVAEGVPWVATNTDSTVPTPDGPGPGNGALVDLVARYSGRTPVVAGKPNAPLFEETLLRVGGERPLVIGDRLDTDIEGAVGLGWDSLLVMTGVSGVRELAGCVKEQRPSYVAADLTALDQPQPAPERSGESWTCGGWTASPRGGVLQVDGDGSRHDWWRVLAAAVWTHLDATGSPVDTDALTPPR